MILLFGKYYGKDTSEVPSGYLIFIIEELKSSDWSLIRECKKELSARLKLDWQPPTDKENELTVINSKLIERISALEKIISISAITRNWNYYKAEMYLQSPELLKSDLLLIKELSIGN